MKKHIIKPNEVKFKQEGFHILSKIRKLPSKKKWKIVPKCLRKFVFLCCHIETYLLPK